MYTISPSFVEICLKMTKLCCFNQNSPILGVSNVVFPDSLSVALKKSRFVGDEMRMRTWRRTTELLLEVTTVGTRVDSSGVTRVGVTRAPTDGVTPIFS